MNYLGDAPVERSVKSGIEYTFIRGNGLHQVELGKRTLFLASGLHWSETLEHMQAAVGRTRKGVGGPTAIITPEYATLEDGPADLIYEGDGEYPLIDDRIRDTRRLSEETDATIYLSSALSQEMSRELELDHLKDEVDPTRFFCTSLAFKRGVLLSATNKHALVGPEVDAGVVSGTPDLEVDEEGLSRISCSDLFNRTQYASHISRAAVRNIITHCMWAFPGYAEQRGEVGIIMGTKNPHTGELPRTYEEGLDYYYGANLIHSADFHIFPKLPSTESAVVVDGGRVDIPAYNLVAIRLRANDLQMNDPY